MGVVDSADMHSIPYVTTHATHPSPRESLRHHTTTEHVPLERTDGATDGQPAWGAPVCVLLLLQVQSACPSFAAASTGLRSTVDDTGRAFGSLLDHLTHAPPPPDDAPASAHAPVDSFLQAAASAESLEHFHLFTQPEETEEEDKKGERARAAEHGGATTLQLHTDLGLFIIMTPGQYLDVESGLGVGDAVAATASANAGAHGEATATAGLYVQLPSGEVVTPTFPKGSLLLMAGEGAARWVSRRKPLGMYAAAHEVVLPMLAGTGVGRAWYGRMFFPARDALPLEARGRRGGEEGGGGGDHDVITFGAARDATHAAFFNARNDNGGAQVDAQDNIPIFNECPRPLALSFGLWRAAVLIAHAWVAECTWAGGFTTSFIVRVTTRACSERRSFSPACPWCLEW